MGFQTTAAVSLSLIASGLVVACDSTSPSRDLERPTSLPRPPSLIAFSSDSFHSVFTMRPDGSELRIVAQGRRARRSGNLSFNHPQWSPDGQYLAYFRVDGEDPGRITLQVSRWDGSEAQGIGPDGMDVSNLEWAPIEGRLAFYRTTGFPGSSEFYGASQVYTVRQDGTDQRRLSSSGSTQSLVCPSWSPDGSRVAFVDRLNALWTARTDGSDQRLVFAGAVLCASWSPDGSRIAFVKDLNRETEGLDPRREIFVVNPDGTDLRRLTRPPNSDDTPVWSPDGSRLAFDGFHNGVSGLFHMRPDGSDVVQAAAGIGIGLQMTWSPDGSQLAFVSGVILKRDIFLVNADGTGLRNITNSPVEEYDPDWK